MSPAASKRRVLRNLPSSAVTFGATPDPVPSWWVRALLENFHCGQREASRLLRYDARVVRRWVNPADGRTPTWADCELLRRLLVEREFHLASRRQGKPTRQEKPA